MAKDKETSQKTLEKQLKEAIEAIPEIELPAGNKEKEENTDNLDLSEFSKLADGPVLPAYTTDIINKIQEIDGTITADQLNELIQYGIKGGVRPEFADSMLTQIVPKIEEALKITALLQLLQVPELLDRKLTLQKAILTPEIIKNLTYADMTEMAANLNKEIKDIQDSCLKIVTQLSRENHIQTAAERMANMIMGLSESSRKRLEELLQDLSDESSI